MAGFDALAPDLYKGTVVPYHDTDAAGKEMNSLDFMDATTQTVRGAAQYLARNGAKVGLTGFCLGGAVTIIGATKIPRTRGRRRVLRHPAGAGGKACRMSKSRCRRISPTRTTGARRSWSTRFEKGMKAAGKSLELFRYDAEHAFVNEQRASVHDRRRRTRLGQGDGIFQEASRLMKIFCTGASGYIGGSVAAHLVASGHQVTGLVRSPDKADAVRARGIEPVTGHAG